MVSELRSCFITTGCPLWSSRDLVKSYPEMQHTCSSLAVIGGCTQRHGLSLLGWSKMELSAGSVHSVWWWPGLKLVWLSGDTSDLGLEDLQRCLPIPTILRFSEWNNKSVFQHFLIWIPTNFPISCSFRSFLHITDFIASVNWLCLVSIHLPFKLHPYAKVCRLQNKNPSSSLPFPTLRSTCHNPFLKPLLMSPTSLQAWAQRKNIKSRSSFFLNEDSMPSSYRSCWQVTLRWELLSFL